MCPAPGWLQAEHECDMTSTKTNSGLMNLKLRNTTLQRMFVYVPFVLVWRAQDGRAGESPDYLRCGFDFVALSVATISSEIKTENNIFFKKKPCQTP